jgi:ABC-type microcin C transport system duplicated ATPase subunit YejF
MYILNILFEINARRKQGQETLVISDDIADSFDYKNKYAIVEYLKDVSELDKFCCVFLTHNFDFHRTISSRLNIKRPYRLFAAKNGRDLALKKEKYQDFLHTVRSESCPVLQQRRRVHSPYLPATHEERYCSNHRSRHGEHL